ncbi:retrovirus-related pol polyprotein from transposon TNT 1-94, partial [Tanacetum coccineum]
MNSSDPNSSCRPTKVEVPNELPKVIMVNTSLKKLKHHLAGFDVVVKERTTATSITEGSWGFEHTKACFRDKIIPFVKALKDLFNTFDQYLIDELSEVQNVFHQMEQAVKQHRLELKIVKLETKLLNKKDFIKKATYDKLFRSFTTLKKHCISLEVDTQLNQENFQRENSVSNQCAPSFEQYFELNELKAQSQKKDTVIKKLKEKIKSLSENMNEDKVKKDIEEIETINIEVDHRMSKLIAENEHLKQTYKQLYGSIKPIRIRSKEQCDALVSQVNQKSLEISDLNHSKLNANSELLCVKCNGWMLSDNHDLCVLDFINDVNARTKSKSAKKIAFRQHTCFIRNLEGVDLLTGSQGNNLYTLSLRDMMVSSPICLLSKASKTKSWLWHRRLSYLHFGAINHLARHGLVRGLPKLKFEKDHLCSACAMGKSKKKPHKPKSEDTNQEKLCFLHMDLYGPMRVTSVNGKKYILVIVDD